MQGADTSRPTLVAVINQLPWPLDRGGHLRSFHLLRALARRFRVQLIGGTAAANAEEAIDALHRAGVDVVPVPLVARTPWSDVRRATTAALRREPFILYHRHPWRTRSRALRDVLRAGRPDVFYLDHLNSFPLAPQCSGAPRVMDQNSVCSTMVRRAAGLVGSRGGRIYVRHQARLLERVERRAARTVEMILGVSAEDVGYFTTCGARACLVPNGVDCASYDDLPIGARQGPPLLLFVGDMAWAPNVAAATHLARSVLPAVRMRHPDARLRIVGREPTTVARALAALPHVDVTGTVPDVRPHLAAAHLLAVPLDVGGGTRVKILEAFAAGLPVVSSAVGCEGLPVVDGHHLSVARTEQFAAAALDVLAHPEQAARRADRARELVRADFDWAAVGARACTAIEELLPTP
ncbi:MAG TPA: glycosyltransferase family 4 protein [Candidatus Binatia bacterium]|jgi:glycosyltransferase involved in cell wall biosynthesis|nr:glycosyltransferase family 4 protein [Candidatus Binatia bacterium]